MSDSQKLKIVSGGQTGVDRAALDAALASGTSAGGCFVVFMSACVTIY